MGRGGPYRHGHQSLKYFNDMTYIETKAASCNMV